MLMYDVIIPALNEQETIGQIVREFRKHPRIREVNVMVDGETTDDTYSVALNAGAVVYRLLGVTGKGQLIRWGLTTIVTEYVVLSDADYTGLNHHTITLLAPQYRPMRQMRIVVPKTPTKKEWRDSKFPIEFNHTAWAWNSGLRSFPTDLAYGIEFHGYLTETQLNKAAKEREYEVSLIPEASLHAPLRFTQKRMEAMEADRQWGLKNGVFDV